MPSASRPRLVAIALDAAEPWLVRQLAARGELPTLARILASATSGRVDSEAHIGALSVWPSFVAGTDLAENGMYSFWTWNPSEMRIALTTFESVRPFWRQHGWSSRALGVVDMPLVPRPVPLNGFEICEWGSHYFWLGGGMQTCPPSLASRVDGLVGEYPTRQLLDGSATGDHSALLEHCLDGAQRRGRLLEMLIREESPEILLTSFTEIHRAGHLFWHTAPARGGGPAAAHGPGMVDVFREVDRQIGRVLAASGEDTAVLVFALHGMRDARGRPVLLDPVLTGAGLAVPAPEPVASKLKRWTPTAVKRVYHRLAAESLRVAVATRGMTPRYDWSRTRAFPLPTDQHGWVRVNLKGREAAGIVEPADYGRVCRQVTELLKGLRMEDGTPVVSEVLQTTTAPLASSLPDLVAHWAPVATAGPFRLREPAITCEMEGPRLTGQHTPEGFWALASPRPEGPPDGTALRVSEFGRVLGDLAR